MAFRENLSRVQHEVTQQTKLCRGELDIHAVPADALTAFIQIKTGGFQRGLVGQPVRTSQLCLNTQLQFFRMKRLGQVIIGTCLQAFYAL